MKAFWQLYCEKDIHRITVAELCERAGYNRSTFYQYYADVFAVLEMLEEDLISEWLKMIEEQQIVPHKTGNIYYGNESFSLPALLENGIYYFKFLSSFAGTNLSVLLSKFLI